jgi:transcriptional regulator with XRE-family HTH domain
MDEGRKKRNVIRDSEGLLALANQLKLVRKRHGYTQERLASEAGLELSQIARIETAKTNPTVSTMMRIARTLDIPVNHLFEFKLEKGDYTK